MDDNEEDCRMVVCLLNCRKEEYSLIYLGIPVRPNKLLHNDWLPMIHKTHKKLVGWKGSSLSIGGKLNGVNFVLSTLLYVMSIYQLPIWVIKRIVKIRRNFFWKGNKDCKGFFCLVKWKKVCKKGDKDCKGIFCLVKGFGAWEF